MNDLAAKFDDDDLRHLADLALIHSFPRGGKRNGVAWGGIDGARACGSKVGQLCKWVCSNVARSLAPSLAAGMAKQKLA